MSSLLAVLSPGLVTSTMPSARTETLSRLRNGLVAAVIALVAQLLIAGIQWVLNGKGVDLPASILAMGVVFLLFQGSGCVVSGIDSFYMKHLQSPVSLCPFLYGICYLNTSRLLILI